MTYYLDIMPFATVGRAPSAGMCGVPQPLTVLPFNFDHLAIDFKDMLTRLTSTE